MMPELNWWLMALAFLLGLALTFAMMIRRVTREVPVTGAVPSSAVSSGEASGAAPLKGTVEQAAKVDKGDRILEKEPYGTGSIRVSARAQAPTGYTIKGDKDTGRYFTLDSPQYAAIEAEVWFANEDSAAKAGFLHWDAQGEQRS
jgi:uncharacterized membrane protein ArfC